MFRKTKLFDMPDIYTVNAFSLGNKFYIGMGPEKSGNPYLITYPSLNKVEAGMAPGGMMSLIPVPGRTDMLVSVMGLFPPFQGQDAGVYRHTCSKGIWNVEKMLHLPFAHRCEILRKNQINYLFTSTVSRCKREPTDWSEAGEVFLTILTDPFQPMWSAEKIMGNIFRNHGMLKTFLHEKEVICVSGTEGIFSLCPEGHEVRVTQVFDKEVSEFVFIDMNGDGQDELVTIEPFHGDSLNIYKLLSTGWEKIYDAPLAFGHGLSSGRLAGVPVVVVGNRADVSSLDLFCMIREGNKFRRYCIEKGTGTTQTQIFHYLDEDYILSANQLKSEAALYCLRQRILYE